MVNLFIVYELDAWVRDLNTNFALGDCLSGGVKITKHFDPDKMSHSGYGIEFDTRGKYSLPDGSIVKKIIIFGVDMSKSVNIDDKRKEILVLGKGPTQRLNYTLVAETQCSINFRRPGIKFYLSLHYNGGNNFLFVKPTKTYQFKAEDLEIEDILVFRI